MKPLECTTTMTKETDSQSVRDAVKQLSFAYRRSAKAHMAEITSGETPSGDGPTPAVSDAPVATPPSIEDETHSETLQDALRRAEAVLFAAGQPLSAAQIAEILPPDIEPATVLMTLKRTYAGRGIKLVEVAGKWRFQTAEDLSFLFVEERHVQKKLSQASLETLSIIAYGQPVTRAEIESVRGVAVSKSTIDGLLETGWVKVKGRRKTPGRPVTLGTTDKFLEHFGLEDLSVLPGKAELEAEGLLSDVVPDGFEAGDLPGMDETDIDMHSDPVDEAEFVADFNEDESTQ